MDCQNWDQIDSFIDLEENPYEKQYAKTEYKKLNYIFIIPQSLSMLFS